MVALRLLLAVSAAAIYVITILASVSHGLNWPAVVLSDLPALDWRSQFDTDFIVHLFLLATWVTWREGSTMRAYLFGLLSIVMGGMFSFPYLLHATYTADGDPKRFLLGSHHASSVTRV